MSAPDPRAGALGRLVSSFAVGDRFTTAHGLRLTLVAWCVGRRGRRFAVVRLDPKDDARGTARRFAVDGAVTVRPGWEPGDLGWLIELTGRAP